LVADGKIQGIFRHENSMGSWKIVILWTNRNSGGAKILFFEKFRFWMVFAVPKNGAASALSTR